LSISLSWAGRISLSWAGRMPTPQENFLFVERASCPFLTASPTHPTRKFPLCGTGILPVINICGTGILPVLNNNSSRTAANSSNYSRTNQMSQTQSFRNFTSVCQTLEHPRYYFWLFAAHLKKERFKSVNYTSAAQQF
jgi:hypothetical protein